MEDKTTTDLNEVEKAKSDSSDKLIDLEIIPPTSMEDQLDVETQNDQHGASDDPEPIEVRNCYIIDQPQVP